MTRRARCALLLLLAGAALAVLLLACGDGNPEATFDPDTGEHVSGWLSDHGSEFLDDAGACEACHGEDLGGGISGISCFTRSFDGTFCHGAGAHHGAGFGGPDVHGPVAKSAPGEDTGFASCTECHGGDYAGGAVRISCFTAPCHNVPAPHPPEPWLFSPLTHTTTDVGNAGVCAECHLGESGVPVNPGTPVGCFNSTLCHAIRDVHPAGWSDAAEHGAAAKAAPGMATGFEYCQSCHGEDFTGGIANVDCESCHGVPAPHPPMPWRDTSPTHTNTHQDNAVVCGECHLGDSGVPVDPGTPVGCFNNTLCHSLEVHPAGWSTDHAIGLDTPGDVVACGTAECHGTAGGGGAVGISCFECHLGGPLPGPGIMHPNRWPDPENEHPDYLEALNKDARSCSPTRSGVAVFCHGPGLPNNPATIFAPPNGSWQRDPDGDPTCYDCHGKEWTLP